MAIEAVCIILDITEIILFAKRKLAPLTFLVLQVVKTTIWTIIFIIYVVRLATVASSASYELNSTILFLSGDIEALIILYVPSLYSHPPWHCMGQGDWATEHGLLMYVYVERLSFIATLIYASVIYHRHRRARSPRVTIPSSVDHETSPQTANSEGPPTYRTYDIEEYNSGGSQEPVELEEPENGTRRVRVPGRDVELEGEGGLYELDATRVDRFGRLTRVKSERSEKKVKGKTSWGGGSGRSKRSLRHFAELG